MSAVEEMAGMDVLCSDKTGTLTLNKLSIDLAASHPMGGEGGGAASGACKALCCFMQLSVCALTDVTARLAVVLSLPLHNSLALSPFCDPFCGQLHRARLPLWLQAGCSAASFTLQPLPFPFSLLYSAANCVTHTPLPTGADVNGLVKYAALSADVVGEEAIDLVLHNTYPDKEHLWAPAGPYRRLKFVPFNPVDKFTMAVVQEEGSGRVMRLMKGAPQVGSGRVCVCHSSYWLVAYLSALDNL
jgi:magnesium-transporting ATPase (P-type)